MTYRIRMKARHFTAAVALLGITLFLPGWTQAYADSAQVTELLQRAQFSANQLKIDAQDMASYSATQTTWTRHASQISRIKEHVNNSGKILADLHDARDGAEPWQQEAIDAITPLLKDLASNTTAIIDHLNDRQHTWHPEYEAYLKDNADTAADLSRVIDDYIAFGKAKSKSEKLGKQLGFQGS